MHLLDWLVVAAYAVLVIGLGFWLAGRAGRSTDEYLVAGRKMPWWLIGFSDVANADGADALWVLTIFTGAFMGLYRAYWVSYVVMLPFAVVWARYWRRLRLVSPAQLMEARYGGRAAGAFRGFSAVYGVLIPTSILIAYVFKSFAQVLAPFFGWPVDTVLLLFCATTLAYTVLSGLLGDCYTDVPQFILILVGRVILAGIVLGLAGGLDAVLEAVPAIRGAEFLRPYPPSHSDVYGDFALDGWSLAALMAAGMLHAAATPNVVVQRSLAARSEWDAALGQVLNALLTLVFRMIPLVLIGLGAVALYDPDFAGEEIWADIVREHAAPGILGLLVVGIVAGYMSTLDSFLNAQAAALFNDFYRRHLRPNCSEREGVVFCRLALVGVTGLAYLWARVLLGRIDASWLNFINSILFLFMLPLALLRWTWWRLNIWGEVVGFVIGFPLAYLVWFVWGFEDEPYWKSFAILAGLGWTTVVAATLLTRPESPEVLRRFYETVRPPGFWGPIARGAADASRQTSREVRLDVGAAVVGVVALVSMCISFTAPFSGRYALAAGAGLVCAVSCAAYAVLWRKAHATRPA